jgi:cytochrome b6-f complex iron-sulfur subunit
VTEDENDSSTPPPDPSNTDETPSTSTPRRSFLTTTASAGMAAGLVAGYGAFATVAGRYLYPAQGRPTRWTYVARVANMPTGSSLAFVGPSGERIAIARQGGEGTASDFIALSSTCPHLGCQVHWENDNQRFFCPCHNGVFDPSGKGIAGPPGKAGQSLARYPLKIENGLLYIEVPVAELASSTHLPGHDPCLKRG